MKGISKAAIAMASAVIGFASTVNAQTATPWQDRITLGGDFRFRLQRDIGNAANGAEDSRMRIRARMSVAAKVTDQVTVATRLSTGGVGPHFAANSWNQTLGAGGSKYEFDIELAYANYAAAPGLNIYAGKAPTQFWTAGYNTVVWSPTWAQEGVQVKYAPDMEDLKPFATIGFSNINDKGSRDSGRDNTMFGAQIGTSYKAGEFSLSAAVGSYNYANIKGTAVGDFYNTNQFPSTTIVNGNSATTVGPTTVFANDYKLLNVGLELNYNLGFAPIKVYYEYVQNSDVSEMNKGSIVGVKLGALKEVGNWYVEYNYRDVARDATFAVAGDAFWNGGGTDVYGHNAQIGYQVAPNIALGLNHDSGMKLGRSAESWLADVVMAF